MSRHVMSRAVTTRHSTSGHVTLLYVTFCYVMLCYAVVHSPALHDFHYTIDGQPLNRLSLNGDFGVAFASDLTFDSHIIDVCSRANPDLVLVSHSTAVRIRLPCLVSSPHRRPREQTEKNLDEVLDIRRSSPGSTVP